MAGNDKRNYGQELEELGRRMGMYSILYHDAVAKRLGLNITDHKCLDHILRNNKVTAGELSRVTGLTSGAITGVIDRLEKAGFVRRASDPRDRRKVVIAARPERLREIGRIFESLGRGMAQAMASFSTRETEVIVDFMGRISEVMRVENLRLRRKR